MFWIYLKTSIRHIRKSRLYSAINILGIATGITAMLLAILYWKDETSFDRFHKNHKDLYRITTTLKENKESSSILTGGTGQVQGPAFLKSVPEMRSFTRVMGGDIYSIIISSNKNLKVRSLFVDANFLQVFTFPMLRGNNKTVFNETNSIVLSETSARKLFNSIDVVGRVIQLDADPSFDQLKSPLIVRGVVKDPPANSSIQFDVLFPFSFMQLAFTDEAWLNAYLGTFITLAPGTDLAATEKKFNTIYTKEGRNQLREQIKNYGFDPEISYGIQPISEMHLNPLTRTSGNAEGGVINGSSSSYSIIFLVIAGFILLMATINFINISISGALKRSKEVGIRKVSGGTKFQIIWQFLTESALLTSLAFIISLCCTYFLLPLFNQLTVKQLNPASIFNSSVLIYFLLLLAIVICSTGIYPAYLLSTFKPADVLYKRQRKTGNSFFGKALVVCQFTPAIFLLIASIVYYKQMDFVRTKDLGYNPGNIITTSVYGNRDYNSVVNILKNELTATPFVKSVSVVNSGYPASIKIGNKTLSVFHKIIDENYLPLMEIPILAGNNLLSGSSGKNAMIVNESFIKETGIKDPIGYTIKLGENFNNETKMITGIVKDHHFSSLRVKIAPMMMFKSETTQGDLLIKVDRTKSREAINFLEKIYTKAMPSAIFEYSFLDELNAREFLQEQRWQKLISISTMVSLIVCCLGLFGLAHLNSFQRVKEIGIRKVLGASVSQIIILLSSDFLKLVVISFVIAAPLAAIIMNNWLSDFPYRIIAGPTIFLGAAFISVTVAILAVISQSFRTAISNPVKSLRSE